MQSYEIKIGNTVILAPDRTGRSITGVVLSKGPKNCMIVDTARNVSVRAPYACIIACNDTVEEIPIVRAKVNDVIQTRDGEKFRITKTNATTYIGTHLRNGQSYRIPVGNVCEIVDMKSERNTWLLNKGLTDNDIQEFEALFA